MSDRISFSPAAISSARLRRTLAGLRNDSGPRPGRPAARGRAVVLGASVGGLVAARACSERYEQVIVLERDELPDAAVPRGGVPQGRHVHVLLTRGAGALEELFPGLLADLAEAGVPMLTSQARVGLRLGGHSICRDVTFDRPFPLPSRPLLENRVRARLPPNVTTRSHCRAAGLVIDGDRVTGVRTDDGEVVPADLVVDATGRAGRLPTWLTEAGFPAPPEERLEVDVRYLTVHLQLPGLPVGFDEAVHTGPHARRPLGVAAQRQLGEEWIVTVYSYGPDHPPADCDTMRAAIGELIPRQVAEALLAGTWPDRPLAYRFPAHLRRRYDRLERFPEGLLVLGDALCSFDPVYGQGMTLAALEALALREVLRAGSQDLARRYFRTTRRSVTDAWQLATGADLAIDAVAGPRPVPVRVLNRYVQAVQAAAEHDPVAATAFVRVVMLERRPTHLFSPAVLARLARRTRPVDALLDRVLRSPHGPVSRPQSQ